MQYFKVFCAFFVFYCAYEVLAHPVKTEYNMETLIPILLKGCRIAAKEVMNEFQNNKQINRQNCGRSRVRSNETMHRNICDSMRYLRKAASIYMESHVGSTPEVVKKFYESTNFVGCRSATIPRFRPTDIKECLFQASFYVNCLNGYFHRKNVIIKPTHRMCREHLHACGCA